MGAAPWNATPIPTATRTPVGTALSRTGCRRGTGAASCGRATGCSTPPVAPLPSPRPTSSTRGSGAPSPSRPRHSFGPAAASQNRCAVQSNIEEHVEIAEERCEVAVPLGVDRVLVLMECDFDTSSRKRRDIEIAFGGRPGHIDCRAEVLADLAQQFRPLAGERQLGGADEPTGDAEGPQG